MKNEKKHPVKAIAFTGTIYLAAFTIMLLLIAPFNIMAQDILQDSDGKQVNTSAYQEVDGSPDYQMDWADGTITRKNGKQYAGKLKYDAYNDQVVFQNSKGNPLTPIFADVDGFTLKGISDNKTDLVFANGFPAVDNQTAASYYVVLSNGKTKLLKHISKTIKESQNFADGTITKNFDDQQAYYMLKNGSMAVIKPGEKNVLAALSDKSTQITAYAKTNKIGFKNDEDLGKIFDYYNTL
jgi:hypothetical protein